MKRVRLFIMLLALQIFVMSNNTSAHNYILLQQNDTSEVTRQLNLYVRLIYSDSVSARKCLEEALTFSRRIGYFNGIARSASSLGSHFMRQFDLSKAENYFLESFNAAKKSGDKTIEANCANNLGTIFEKKGNYSSAISNYLNAYMLFESLKNTNGISATTLNIGIIYYHLNEPEKAKRFFKLSLKLKQELHDSLSMVNVYQGLGNVYFDLLKYDSSKYYYKKCTDLSESVNDAINAGKAYNSTGVIALFENDYQGAQKLFNRALHFSEMKNDVLNISEVYGNLGLMGLNSGNYQAAIAYLDSSLVLSKKFGLKEEMKYSYQLLSKVYSEQEKYKEAFLNLQKFDNLQNDLLAEKSNVTGIEALFVKQKQENTILRLEKEQEKRKTQIVISLAVIFILMIGSTLGFYIYSISQRSKNARIIAKLEKERFKAVIEAQEMERKRIAGDLHDSVGQMLSLSKLQLSEIMDSSDLYSPEHGQMLERSTQIIDEACQEVRNISHNLMPGSLIRLGLPAAVKDLVRKINTSNKIHVSFTCNLDDSRLNENVEISVYRIIQEIFNNILKHAHATEIGINLILHSKDRLELSISDNGIGFDTREIIKSNGIGWKNIYSRLAIINGTMNVNSKKNHGTFINIKVLL